MRVLFIAVALVVGAFVSVFAWAVLSGGPLDGEPHAVIAIESIEQPGAGPAAAASANNENANKAAAPEPAQSAAVATPERPAEPQPSSSAEANTAASPGTTIAAPPPGFSVVGITPPAPPQPAPAPAPPPPAPATRGLQPVALPAEAPEPTQLGPVPVDALVQESRYGPLPRVAADGRRPSDVYARPTRYAARPRLGEPARIAIVIHGFGLSEAGTSQGIAKLPGQVTLGFSPYGRNLQDWVRQAREAGHEVMLQVPLEPFDYPDNDPGPHTLLTNLPAPENLKRLQWLMARFTGYVGVTNQMGAKFAASQESFLPVLEEVKSRGLIYLDDGAAVGSTAGRIARDLGLSYSVAQIVIDANQAPQEIDQALAKLEKTALEGGLAIGVGSSLPATVEHVSKWAATLRNKGIVLIPVSAAVRAQHQS